MTARLARSDHRLAFIFGIVFLSIILAMAIFRPTPTPFEYTVFRITLALAASGVGAVIPGFLHVNFGNWVRAGGALALFLIVYLVSPVAMTEPVNPNPSESSSNPIPVARDWLEIVDKGDLDRAYQSTDPTFKSRFAKEDMASIIEAERKALGLPLSRKFILDQPLVNPPGMNPGAYRWIGFSTKFKNERRVIYEAIQLRSGSSGWKVIGFSTSVRTDSGNYVSYDPDENSSRTTSAN